MIGQQFVGKRKTGIGKSDLMQVGEEEKEKEKEEEEEEEEEDEE